MFIVIQLQSQVQYCNGYLMRIKQVETNRGREVGVRGQTGRGRILKYQVVYMWAKTIFTLIQLSQVRYCKCDLMRLKQMGQTGGTGGRQTVEVVVDDGFSNIKLKVSIWVKPMSMGSVLPSYCDTQHQKVFTFKF